MPKRNPFAGDTFFGQVVKPDGSKILPDGTEEQPDQAERLEREVPSAYGFTRHGMAIDLYHKRQEKRQKQEALEAEAKAKKEAADEDCTSHDYKASGFEMP